MTDHDPNETAASEAAATPDDGARVSNINRPWLIRIVIITTCLLGYAGWSLYDAYVAYPERGEASFDLRSLFPVIDLHVPVIIAAFAGEGDAPRLLGKIKVPAAALESNQRYFKMVDMGAVDASTGEVAMGGKLDIGLTYYRDSSEEATIALARQYVKPLCSDKWYYNPIPELEQEKVAKRHKELVIAQLAAGNPPVREHIAREILDFSRHEFNSRMIQTSIARLQCFAAEGMEIIAAVDDIFSWRNPYVTAFVQAVLFFMVNYPKLLLPGVLFLAEHSQQGRRWVMPMRLPDVQSSDARAAWAFACAEEDSEVLGICLKLGHFAPPGIVERLMAAAYGLGTYHKFWKRGALIQNRHFANSQLLHP